MLAVLCTQQRCSRVVGHTSPSAFQNPSAPLGNRNLRRRCQAATLQIEQQITPRLRALANAIGEADKLLPAFRRRADDDQDALCLLLEPGLQMDAVGPAVDVALC